MSSGWRFLKKYLDDAGFQPSKYIVASSSVVALPRRWFWITVLVSCVILLGVFCYSRITYFYSFPFTVVTAVDDKLIPLPQAILCPFHEDPIIIPGPQVYANMSDEQIALTATIKFGLPLLDTHSRENILYVNQTTLEFLKQIPSSDARELVSYLNSIYFTAPEVIQQLGDIGLKQDHFSFMKAPATAAMIQRLKGFSNDSFISYTPETIYQLYHQFSLVTQISEINCMFVSDFQTENGLAGDPDCRKYFRPTVFFGEICLQLNEIDGKQLIFNKTRKAADSHNMHIWFDGFAGTSSDKIVLFLTYNNDFLSLIGWSDINSGTSVSVNEVRSTTRLSQPYHKKSCVTYDTDNGFGDCVMDCIFDTDFGNCSFYFGILSNNFADPYSIPKKGSGEFASDGKPLCSIHEHLHRTGFDLYNARKELCYNSCPVGCKTTSMRFDLLQSGPRKGCKGACANYLLFMKLSEPQTYISHVTYTELPLYDDGALLAELGGTMGLFLDATIFTVVHLVEFLYLHLVIPGWRKMFGCKTKKVKIKNKRHRLVLAVEAALPNRADLYNL